jgi:hypothetical protein
MTRNGLDGVRMTEKRPGLWWRAVRDSKEDTRQDQLGHVLRGIRLDSKGRGAIRECYDDDMVRFCFSYLDPVY